MNEKQDLKASIQEALKNFQSHPFVDAAYDFWKVLGYESQRRFEEVSYTYSEFTEAFSSRHQLRDDKALKDHWKQIHILFQLTDEEIRDGLSASSQEEIEGLGFNSIQSQNIKSYLFVAIELEKDQVTRTNLANLTREINRCFAMPVLLLVKTDQTLTISVIYRRRSKKDDAKDVLEKVTLIKDIRFRGSTHRAHIEILFDLSLSELGSKHHLAGFDQLHKAWEQTLDLKELNKKFYKELSNWFFWAVSTVNFPDPDEPDAENRNTIGLIRLLTRIIFVWFMKEKGLVPEELFDLDKVQKIINFSDGSGSSYYKAILQNLFFATLNTEMTKDKAESRRFRKDITGHLNSDFNLHTVFRYKQMFLEPDTAIKKHFGGIPFLNGSLFECLDSEIKLGIHVQKTYVDGFSDRSDNPLKVPDNLFWNGPGQDCDLNDIYGTQNKRYNVKGLLDILHSYKFTIAENTPVEEEVALDPELLGRVFENLLAAYNPETRHTARKETGSFYTPREIVDFMVNESIVAHLCNALPAKDESVREDNELRLRLLLTYADEDSLFYSEEADILIHAIDTTRIIDPACGSGAFPMGLLLKMVYILHKLDPDNKKWKARQIENLKASASAMQRTISDAKFRDETTKKLQESIRELEKTFEDYDLDYSRKLYLIERCIYGVDIQPIAIQISQLRFFISLLVDQTPKPRRFNLGIEPLPNLETNLIAANSLIPINLGDQREIFFDNEIEKYKQDIMDIHNEYFSAHSRKKKTELRAREEKLRSDFVQELKKHDIPIKNADLIASWKPYQSHNYAQFFDPEIMFGFKGFDIVIANPPYIESRNSLMTKEFKDTIHDILQHKHPEDHNLISRGSDMLIYFIELSVSLLKNNGISCLITQNSWLASQYGHQFSQFLLRNANVVRVIDSDYKYFDTIQINTVITHITTLQNSNNHVSFEVFSSRFGDDHEKVQYRLVNHNDQKLINFKWDLQLIEYDIISDLVHLLNMAKSNNVLKSLSVGQGLNISSSAFHDENDPALDNVPKNYVYPMYTKHDGAFFRVEKTKKCLVDSGYSASNLGIDDTVTLSSSRKIPLIFLPRGIGRHFACANKAGAFTDSCVEIYSSISLDNHVINNLLVFLNSSFFWLIREMLGRKNLGGGMLKAEAIDLRNIPLYLDFSQDSRIDTLLEQMYGRSVLPSLKEIKTDEHQEIDKIVGEYLEFSKQKRDSITNTLIKVIQRREKKSKG